MKNIYLASFLCFFCFSGFATTWYSQNTGDASVLTNWNDSANGSGSAPTTFLTQGDVWVMTTDMTCAPDSFVIAGSLVIDSANFQGPDTLLYIGQNLTLKGNALLSAPYSDAPVMLTIIAIGGNLSLLDQSYITNTFEYTTLLFNNTSSSVTSPQTITWTSIGAGNGVSLQMNIATGATVELLSNVVLPAVTNPFQVIAGDTINGTIICGNYSLNANGNFHDLILDSGATLYTTQSGGVDASLINGAGLLLSSSANYIFNGDSSQITGASMPHRLFAGGSLVSENPSGVTLSQDVFFDSTSTLALSGGRLILGAYNAELHTSASITGTFSDTSMVVTNGAGQLRRRFNADGSFLFPVGDTAGNYSPITLDVTGSSFSYRAYVAATVTNSKDPHNANRNNYLNRYWSVWTHGIDMPSYSVALAQYVPSDVVGSEAAISAGEYTGALPWMKFGAVNVVSHSLFVATDTSAYSEFTGITTAGPSVTQSPGTAVCPGASVTLTIVADSPFNAIPLTAGITPATDSTATVTPDTTTSYMAVITDGNGLTDTVTVTVTVNPAPHVDTVTGGGAYCAGAGGRHIYLSGSDTGINYMVYFNDTSLVGTFAGTDTSLDFGADTTAGNYTVVATNTATGCSSQMYDSATIAINPLPDINTVSGGGPYCAGGFGRHIYLSGSDTGANYMVYLNDTGLIGTYAGNGSALTFGPDTAAGGYTVVATYTVTGCSSHMSDSATIVITPVVIPSVSISSGISVICAGTTVTFTATPVHGGVEPAYLWVVNNIEVGIGNMYTYVPANGDVLSVKLTSDTVCAIPDRATDTTIVAVHPLPDINTVTGSGSYCAGTGGRSIGLSGSDTGVNYVVYFNDTGVVGTFAGTGSSLSFGSDTAAGNYTVVATYSVTGCSDNMNGSATIIITPVVVPSVSISSSIVDTICAGESITFTATPVHGGEEPSYQWMVNGAATGGGASYTYVPVNGDVLSVKLTSDTVCAIPDTATDTMTVTVHPKVSPVITLTASPGDTLCMGVPVTITAAATYSGPAPSFAWVRNMAVVSTDTSYTYLPDNGDNIYCVMHSDYFCLLTATAYSNVINMVIDTPIVPSVYIVVHPGTYVSTGSSVTLIAEVTNGGANPSYQWYVNGAFVAGDDSDMLTDVFSNMDSISVVITRNDPCHLSNFSSAIIHASDEGVGQLSLGNSDIKLLPDPNNGNFTIAGTLGAQNGTTVVGLEIDNMLGQSVYTDKISVENGAINGAVHAGNLANGVYVLNLRSEQGNVAIRFVISR